MVEQTKKVLKRLTPGTQAVKNAKRECLANAVLAIQEANGTLSLSQAARRFDVSKTTFRARLQGVTNQATYWSSQQKLTTEEEGFLKSWVLQLQAWR